MRLPHKVFARPLRRLVLASCLVLGHGREPLLAQQATDTQVVDKPTLQLLLSRIDQLETRVKQLEAERQPAPDAAESAQRHAESLTKAEAAMAPPPPTAATTAMTPKPQEPETPELDSVMADRMDVSKTLLRIRGFGDISLHGDTQPGDKTSFSLGQLDLFVTSDVSDKFKFLSEIVFEAGADDIYGVVGGQANTFGVDIERYLLQYSFNDYLNISAGRGHTAIGYYNTAYHHSSWLQTTTDRPLLFAFEDQGGILPIHMIGVSTTGSVPSGRLGLHYVAEIGNGRSSAGSLLDQPVQNEVDDANRKAFNLELFARPDVVPGLQTGFSVYHDVLSPANAPRVDETIYAAHAILIRPKYEWLNEVVLDRHTLLGSSKSFNTPAFYTLTSRQLGMYRPYFRYQYINGANTEPIFPNIALRHGPSAGLRFDASESVALKFQYDYTFLRNKPGYHGLNLQLGFTF